MGDSAKRSFTKTIKECSECDWFDDNGGISGQMFEKEDNEVQ